LGPLSLARSIFQRQTASTAGMEVQSSKRQAVSSTLNFER
jgi:hypothetical protein